MRATLSSVDTTLVAALVAVETLMRETVLVIGAVLDVGKAAAECAACTLSLCGSAAQYAKMVERMRTVNERRRMLRRIHWRARFVGAIFFFRIGCGGFWKDVVVEVVSVLSFDLVDLNFRFFFPSVSLITDVGGGGKYSNWLVVSWFGIVRQTSRRLFYWLMCLIMKIWASSVQVV